MIKNSLIFVYLSILIEHFKKAQIFVKIKNNWKENSHNVQSSA